MVSHDVLAFDPVAFEAEIPSGWFDLGPVPAIANSPTPLARYVATMQAFNGRVYLGYGDFSAIVQPSVDVIAIVGTSYVTVVSEITADAIWQLRVMNGELWIPITDPDPGTDPDAIVIDSTHTATALARSDVAPWHLFDAAYFNGKNYLCGSRYVTGSDDAACVWRQDSPTSWVATDLNANNRIYGLAVIGSTLYAFYEYNNTFQTTDGVNWTLATSIGYIGHLHNPLPVTGGALIGRNDIYAYAGSSSLDRYTGTSVALAHSNVKSHSMGDDGFVYILTGTDIKKASADGTSFTTVVTGAPSNGSSVAYCSGVYYVGTADSHVWRYS